MKKLVLLFVAVVALAVLVPNVALTASANSTNVEISASELSASSSEAVSGSSVNGNGLIIAGALAIVMVVIAVLGIGVNIPSMVINLIAGIKAMSSPFDGEKSKAKKVLNILLCALLIVFPILFTSSQLGFQGLVIVETVNETSTMSLSLIFRLVLTILSTLAIVGIRVALRILEKNAKFGFDYIYCISIIILFAISHFMRNGDALWFYLLAMILTSVFGIVNAIGVINKCKKQTEA